jgi:hypothetical protein
VGIETGENMFEPNIANSVFPSFNDNHGLMLCGYEWGFSKSDQDSLRTNEHKRSGVSHVFSNKAAEYGEIAKDGVQKWSSRPWRTAVPAGTMDA